jgi:hypothetical protein
VRDEEATGGGRGREKETGTFLEIVKTGELNEPTALRGYR